LKILMTGFACLLLAGAAQAQATSPTPALKSRPEAAPPPAATTNSTVSPDTPVITVRGYCEKPVGGSAAPSDCKTVVTRSEFEKMVPPNTPPANRKRVVDSYLQLLAFAEKGHELGLDQGADFDQQMRMIRLNLLARLAFQQMRKDVGNVSDSEIEDYYHQHAADFRAFSYDRIYVPKQKVSDIAALKPNDPDATKKREASETQMKQAADKLRERALAGEDFTKLQQAAYDLAENKATASSTKIENVRKANLPATVIDLKKGEVSPVVSEQGGFMIYKADDIKDLPLSGVRDEITGLLQSEKLNKERESLENAAKANTVLDESYFATPAPPSLQKPGETPAPAPGKK
jgi:hypothetical protein